MENGHGLKIKENSNREMILAYIRLKGELNISQIVADLKISRPVVYLHLKVLEEQKLITRTKDSNNKKGKPVTVKINEDILKNYEDSKILELLKKISKDGEIDLTDLKKEKGQGFLELEHYHKARLLGYVGNKIYLTESGKKFLQDNEKLNSSKDKA